MKKLTIAALLVLASSNVAFALDASDLASGTSSIGPSATGTTTTITTTNNIDTFQWNKFNVGSGETAFFQFTASGQTAVNYIDPGRTASSILGIIQGSTNNGYVGNVMLFNTKVFRLCLEYNDYN